MKQLLISILAVMGLSTIAQADTIYGLYADANYWHTSSDIKVNNAERDTDDKGQYMISASLEHPVPFVPNARVRHASLNSQGKGTWKDTELDLSSTDVIAYYELLDNVVSVDVGLGAKVLQGSEKTDGLSVPITDFDKTLPMAYGSVGGKLPFTRWSAKAELALAQGSDVKATDAQAELKYDFVQTALLDVGAKVGYRILMVDYDQKDNNPAYKADFKGPYVGVEFHF